MPDRHPDRILVIKLSALGDFILSVGAFQAIRRHHRAAQITLLTTPPFARLGESTGCFDTVWVDTRAPWWRVDRWAALARRLRAARFDRVYDLQRSQRTRWYFRLAGRPPWCGDAPGCAFYCDMTKNRDRHICERQAQQLAVAGLAEVARPDLSFMTADLGRFDLPARYALLVPGSSAHRAIKRWPAERYAAVAQALAAQGVTPLLIGGKAEAAEIAVITGACSAARDLSDRTSLEELATLARGATLAVGNDTGPMHLIAAAGAPSLMLLCRETDALLSGPIGRRTEVLQRDFLADLETAPVIAAAQRLMRCDG